VLVYTHLFTVLIYTQLFTVFLHRFLGIGNFIKFRVLFKTYYANK